MNNLKRILGLLAISALLVLGSCNRGGGGTPNPATEFSFKTTSGQSGSISQYLGKPLVVNFWADWCGPCVAELPGFQQVYDKHGDSFELLAVSSPTSKDAEGFWKQNGYTFPMVIDETGSEKFGVEAIPTTLFIDAKGNLVEKSTGMMSHADFEAKLLALINP